MRGVETRPARLARLLTWATLASAASGLTLTGCRATLAPVRSVQRSSPHKDVLHYRVELEQGLAPLAYRAWCLADLRAAGLLGSRTRDAGTAPGSSTRAPRAAADGSRALPFAPPSAAGEPPLYEVLYSFFADGARVATVTFRHDPQRDRLGHLHTLVFRDAP